MEGTLEARGNGVHYFGNWKAFFSSNEFLLPYGGVGHRINARYGVLLTSSDTKFDGALQ
jgi:hypothetical protein